MTAESRPDTHGRTGEITALAIEGMLQQRGDTHPGDVVAMPFCIAEWRAILSALRPSIAAMPPEGMTLVNTELFNEITKHLTPDQMKAICTNEGLRAFGLPTFPPSHVAATTPQWLQDLFDYASAYHTLSEEGQRKQDAVLIRAQKEMKAFSSPSAIEPRWIPVKELTPNEGQVVVGLWFTERAVTIFQGGRWWNPEDECDDEYSVPIYWLPIPNAPSAAVDGGGAVK